MSNVYIYDKFEDLPASYAHRLEGGDSESFFCTLPWFLNFARNVTDDVHDLRLYVRESNPPAGLGLMAMRYQKVRRKVLTPRLLTGLSNYYSPLFGPVFESFDARSDARSIEFAQEIVRAICTDKLVWDAVDIHPLASDSSTFASLISAFRKEKWFVQSYFCFGNWYLKVNGRSYRQYFEALPSVLKNTIERKRKRFMGNGGSVEIITNRNNIEESIDAYRKVYAASWKVPEPYCDFIPNLIQTCAEKNCLRLGIALVEGRPAAAQLWIVYQDTASIYKLAYDDYFSQYSVGTILTAEMMKQAIDVDKVAEIDYLMGDDPYKKSWMSHRRERQGIRAFNARTVDGIFDAIKHIGGRAVKNSARNILNHFDKARIS